MKSFLDFEEKNVEKAIQKACEELNVPREKLKYDIISHGSSGIFGLVGTKKALIRVFVPDIRGSGQTEIASVLPETRLSQTDSAQTDRDTVNALVDEAFGEIRDPIAAPPPKKSRRPRKNKKTEKKANDEPPTPPERIEVIELTETPGAEEVTENADQSDPSFDAPDFEDPLVDEVFESAPPANPEAALAIGRELAEKIFTAMDIAAEISLNPESDPCSLNVKVPEPGVLIGKKGQTLESIQYLVDKIVNKQCGKGSRVIIDVEGYVETRKTELKDLATRLANKTLKSGKPSTMMRMNAHDRRIVHLALKKNPAVRTQSVGDGYYRKLIIFPKNKTRKKVETPKPTD